MIVYFVFRKKLEASLSPQRNFCRFCVVVVFRNMDSSTHSHLNMSLESPSPAVQSAPGPHRWHFPLDFVPPFRFAPVEDGLFRGAYPVLRNFPFLKHMGIRTILSVTPEPATYDLKMFCKAENIEIKYIQADRHKGEPQLLPTDLNEALSVLVQAENYPLYMHCLDGRHVIGLVVMALRKLQCWDYGAMQMEYERFAREGNNETAFIMDYAGGFAFPQKMPSWLVNSPLLFDSDGRARRHPTLKVKHHHAPSAASGSVASSLSHSHGPVGIPATLALAVSGDRAVPPPATTLNVLRSSGGTSPPAAVMSNTPLTYLDVASIAPLRVVQGNCAANSADPSIQSAHENPSTPKKQPGLRVDIDAFCVVPSPDLQMLSVRSALCRADNGTSNFTTAPLDMSNASAASLVSNSGGANHTVGTPSSSGTATASGAITKNGGAENLHQPVSGGASSAAQGSGTSNVLAATVSTANAAAPKHRMKRSLSF